MNHLSTHLRHACMFASSDPHRSNLQVVTLSKVAGGEFQIYSTDSYRAYRSAPIEIPCDSSNKVFHYPVDQLRSLVSVSKTLNSGKPSSKNREVSIDSAGRLVVGEVAVTSFRHSDKVLPPARIDDLFIDPPTEPVDTLPPVTGVNPKFLADICKACTIADPKRPILTFPTVVHQLKPTAFQLPEPVPGEVLLMPVRVPS